MKTKATLTLSINYDGPGATDSTIRSLLSFMMNHAAGRNLFTQQANLEVDFWEYTIETQEIKE